MTIYKALNNENCGHSKKDFIFQNARNMCEMFEEWKCSHNYREWYTLVDIMANLVYIFDLMSGKAGPKIGPKISMMQLIKK